MTKAKQEHFWTKWRKRSSKTDCVTLMKLRLKSAALRELGLQCIKAVLLKSCPEWIYYSCSPVSVDDLKIAITTADPEIDHTDMENYLCWAFKVTNKEDLSTAEPQEASALIERLKNGNLRRIGKKKWKSWQGYVKWISVDLMLDLLLAVKLQGNHVIAKWVGCVADSNSCWNILVLIQALWLPLSLSLPFLVCAHNPWINPWIMCH